MTMTTVLLQAAGAAAVPAQQGSMWSSLLMIVMLFVVMYFFMIRPQRKQQKELENFRNSLSKGQKVVTAGGIYGTVKEVKEFHILMEVDSNVTLRVDKTAVMRTNADIQTNA
ncbi:MAG: preprotein translocase subunit YajC [Tidjanibacter sp.]|nr:preprotein translocase subunit YajC [Tidjanibacter sp.]MBQ5931054.1 preprotein translocase subunit YajC [Tidjanibacter sp.]